MSLNDRFDSHGRWGSKSLSAG